jgi:hypothetical protein
MANSDNLIPFNQRTESEQREIQSKGGKTSGKKRRQRAALRDTLNALLSAPVKDKEQQVELKKAGVTPDVSGLVALSLIKKAVASDMQAAKLLFTAIGEADPAALELAQAKVDLEMLRLEATLQTNESEESQSNFMEALGVVVKDLNLWSEDNNTKLEESQ